MTSRSYLVEVTDDGQVIIGQLDRVTRTVRLVWSDDGDRNGTWIELTGRILNTESRSSADAAVLFTAGAIRAQT